MGRQDSIPRDFGGLASYGGAPSFFGGLSPVYFPLSFVFCYLLFWFFPPCFHGLGAFHRALWTAKIQKRVFDTGVPPPLIDPTAMPY